MLMQCLKVQKDRTQVSKVTVYFAHETVTIELLDSNRIFY